MHEREHENEHEHKHEYEYEKEHENKPERLKNILPEISSTHSDDSCR